MNNNRQLLHKSVGMVGYNVSRMKRILCLGLLLSFFSCELPWEEDTESAAFSENDLVGTWDLTVTHDSDGDEETGWLVFAHTGSEVELVDDWWIEGGSSILEDPDISNINFSLSSAGVFSGSFDFDYGDEYGTSTFSGNMNTAKDFVTSTWFRDEWSESSGGGFEPTPGTGTLLLSLR